MTLTFDLLTSTLGRLFCLIDMYLICKYHQDLIIGSQYTFDTISLQTCILELDL